MLLVTKKMNIIYTLLIVNHINFAYCVQIQVKLDAIGKIKVKMIICISVRFYLQQFISFWEFFYNANKLIPRVKFKYVLREINAPKNTSILPEMVLKKCLRQKNHLPVCVCV